jgi:ubiquitin carboxyl-terminal hydrolase L5
MDEWCTIESDPGVFTELCETVGIKGVEFEEIYTLDDAMLKSQNPMALIFLFKYVGAQAERPVVNPDDNMLFFAKQVTPNACATQAILNALMNVEGVELGKTLADLKEFTAAFDPQMKGLSLSSCDPIREAHNSFHRRLAFEIESGKQEKEDAFHFVTFMWHGGKVYELDGLQAGPIVIAECPKEDWLDQAQLNLKARIETYQASGSSELRFNLMAVVQSKLAAYETEQKMAMYTRQRATVKLLSLGEDIELLDDLDDDEAPATVPSIDDMPENLEELKQYSAEQTSKIATLEAEIAEEKAKRSAWKQENVLRRTDLTPLVLAVMKNLAAKNQLVPLFDTALEKAKSARTSDGQPAATTS